MSDAVVRAENLTKRYRLYQKPVHRFLDMYGLLWRPAGKYREHAAIDNLSFEVRRGEKVAIIGRNGAGKSTLLKMICGVVTPTSGQVSVEGEVHALLSLGTGFHPDFTGRENVYSYLAHLGIVGAKADRSFSEIVDFSELHDFIDQPVKTYSAGMGVRLMFSAATVITPDILVIDEVLGSGDAYFAKKSFERMRELCERVGTTLLMVTHDLYSAAMFCERLIWIDRGVMKMDGPGKSVLRAYEESIREQEEQRLSSLRLAAVEANLGAIQDKVALPAHLRLSPNDGSPPQFALSHIRFFDGEALLATLGMWNDHSDDRASQAQSGVLVLDGREGNWGELETIDGVPARRMLPYGSIFHKLPLIITSPAIAKAARGGTLSVEIGCLAERKQSIDLQICEQDGAQIASGQFEAVPGGWQDLRTRMRTAESSSAFAEARSPARHGQRAMQITDVRFLGADGTERMRFSIGATMRIKLRYHLNKPDFAECPTIVAAFQQNGVIRSHRFMNDRILISTAEGIEGELEIVANPLLLGAGTYFVTISIFQEGYIKSDRPKKFFAVSESIYDMHARAYEILVEPSARDPFCNDVIFQHPSQWYKNGRAAESSPPHVEEALEIGSA
jgi:lipopolysaccharide transport system ATP-binding protein